MANEVDVKSDGNITARVSGTPEKGGNLNNFIEAGITPAKQRVNFGAGLGITGTHDLGDVKIIGTTGIEAKIAGNVGISAERAAKQHDHRNDAPLRPHGMGIFEARDVLNEIASTAGGEVRNLTVTQVKGLLDEHPNLVKPKTLKNFNQTVTRLQATNYNPPPELAETQHAITKLHDISVKAGSPDINFTKVDEALAKFAPDVHLSDSAKKLAQTMLDQSGGSIDKLYTASQNIPPQLLKHQNAAEIIMPMTLAEINTAAAKTQATIALQGGPDAAADHIGAKANEFLLSTGQPPLPDSALATLTKGITRVNAEAIHEQSAYNSLPSKDTILHQRKMANTLVQIDPEAQASAFIGAGVLSKKANAALIAQESVRAGIDNIDYVAGGGTQVHPAISKSLRAELGTGSDPSVSFSPDVAQKLNLALSKQGTQTGAYVFAEEKKTHWHGIEGAARSETSLGVGATISKALEEQRTAFANAELQATDVHQISGPATTPAKSHDVKLNVKAGVKF